MAPATAVQVSVAPAAPAAAGWATSPDGAGIGGVVFEPELPVVSVVGVPVIGVPPVVSPPVPVALLAVAVWVTETTLVA